jgi:4,5-DOPA dioxygenase extradiol
MPDPLPTLFLSHGAPSLELEDVPARTFLRTLASSLPRPRPRATTSPASRRNSTACATPRPAIQHWLRGSAIC